MTPIIDIDGDDIILYSDADECRWHREAWQFMDKSVPAPQLFTIDGGRVEYELVEPNNEHSEIRLIPSEPTSESIDEATGILRAWVAKRQPGHHAEVMELPQLVMFLPRWPGT